MSSAFIPYYNPNLTLKHLIDFFSPKDKQPELIALFKEYTGKKYILPTFSCRSALYLAYKSLEKNGEVITSPLTCLTAILPIIHNNNTPVFTDIDTKTLNFNTDLIEQKISDKTIAIQVIHFAGYPCNMDSLCSISNSRNIYLIEDCAQAFGAEYQGKKAGSFGDISCFSLAKNLYGIVGGIYATDNEGFYQRAKRIQDNFESVSSAFLYYRFLRNYLKTKSGNSFFRYLHKKLIALKNNRNSETESYEEISGLTNYLRKPDKRIFNISVSQLKSLSPLHKKREQNALKMLEKINNLATVKTPQNNSVVKRSFVKFYISGNFNSKKDIKELNLKGIEAKHLEEDFNIYYQKRFDHSPLFNNNISTTTCPQYLNLHDRLISLPLHEKMTDEDFDKIIKELNLIVNKSSE